MTDASNTRGRRPAQGRGGAWTSAIAARLVALVLVLVALVAALPAAHARLTHRPAHRIRIGREEATATGPAEANFSSSSSTSSFSTALPASTGGSAETSIFSSSSSSSSGDVAPSSSSSTGPAPVPSWSTMTAEELSSLSVAFVATANASDLYDLQPSACSGWREEQLRVVGDACDGLREECIHHMTDDAVRGIGAECANMFTSYNTGGFTSSQLGNLTDDAWAALTPDAVNGFTAESCSAVSSAVMQMLGAEAEKYPSAEYACAGLSGACVSHAPDDAFSEVPTTCAAYLTTDAWAGMRSEQIANMSLAVFKTVKSSQIGALTSACAGLQTDQVALLQDAGPLAPSDEPHTCSALQPTCVTAMPLETLAQVARDCIADMNATTFAILSDEQIGTISADASAGLTRVQVESMVNCGGLHADQIAVLSTSAPFDTCAGFAPSCLALIKADQFGAFEPICFRILPGQSFSALSNEQIGNVSLLSTQGLTAEQLQGLPGKSCAGFQPTQIALLGTINPYDTCSGFTTDCLQHLSPAQLSSLTSECFESIPGEYTASFSLEQLDQISTEAISGVTAAQLIQWTATYGVDFIGGVWQRPYQTSDLGRNAILGFKQAIESEELAGNFTFSTGESFYLSGVTSLQLAYCLEECMTVLLENGPGGVPKLLSLPLHTYRGLRPDQLALVPAVVFEQFSARVFEQLLSDATSAILPAQIAVTGTDRFASIDLSSISVENGAVAALSQAQITSIASSQWLLQWTCAQYNAFTVSQRGWMVSSAGTYFGGQCSSGVEVGSNGVSQKVFFASLIGGILGTVLLCTLAYCLFMRPRDRSDALISEASNSLEYGTAHSSSFGSGGARRRTAAAGISDVSLKQPLNPAMSPHAAAGGMGGRTHVAGSYSQAADVQDLLDDEDDMIGSRF